ncbi:MAG: M20/M25/M40 family metallo-hydrolase [Candidatus Rokuibacteriota bacterium]
MLNGHLDIDPIPSGWVRDPWVPAIEGDRFYGAGIFNMKGGVAAMIIGAVAAKRTGVALPGGVILACVAGELQGGVGTGPHAEGRDPGGHGRRAGTLRHPPHHHQAHGSPRAGNPRRGARHAHLPPSKGSTRSAR